MTKNDFKTLATIMTITAICWLLITGCGSSNYYYTSSSGPQTQSQACMTNMKQLGLGITQYVQDYDEKYPSSLNDTPVPYDYGWATALYPYIKGTGAYKCPSDPTSNSGTTVPISYAFNWNLANGGSPSGGSSDSRLNDLSLTVELCEVEGVLSDPRSTDPTTDRSVLTTMGSGYLGGSLPGGVGKYATGSAPGEQLNVIAAGPIHQGLANYVMADGHVASLAPSAISPGYAASSATNAENTTSNSGNASGTLCLDNVPGDFGSSGCPNPNTATVTFSPI